MPHMEKQTSKFGECLLLPSSLLIHNSSAPYYISFDDIQCHQLIHNFTLTDYTNRSFELGLFSLFKVQNKKRIITQRSFIDFTCEGQKSLLSKLLPFLEPSPFSKYSERCNFPWLRMHLNIISLVLHKMVFLQKHILIIVI